MVKQGFLNLADSEKNRVIEAALDEFAKNDFHKASLNNIIARAGISKGSMYHYFTGKEDIYLYIIGQALEKKARFLKESLAGAEKSPAQMNFFENLEFQMLASVDYARGSYRHHQVALRLQNMPEGELKARIWGRFSEAFKQHLDHMVENALAGGELRSDFDQEFIKRVLQFILLRFTEIYPDYQTLLAEDGNAMRTEMRKIAAFIRQGLEKPIDREEDK